jgi:hypothetical protein
LEILKFSLKLIEIVRFFPEQILQGLIIFLKFQDETIAELIKRANLRDASLNDLDFLIVFVAEIRNLV